MSQADYDVAIIGAGVAGLSAAYFLAPHARVGVFEQESEVAYHSSSRSAAIFIEGYENPVVSRLTQASREFFEHPHGEHPLLSDSGGLTCAGPGEVDRLQDHLKQWQPFCPELQEISAIEARQIIPILRPQWVQAACYDPTWQNIDVNELLSVYQRGLKQASGQIHRGHGIDKLQRDGSVWRLASRDQRWTASVVVNAAGAWANDIAELAQLPALPLTPMRRTAIVAPLGDIEAHWPLMHTISENLYFKPFSPGLMISPQDETPSAPMDAYPLELDIAETMARFEEVADLPVQHLLSQWAGLRTFADDRMPVVGFDPRGDQFFWLAGQGGFGVQTSPALGRLAADHILGRGQPDSDIDMQRWL